MGFLSFSFLFLYILFLEIGSGRGHANIDRFIRSGVLFQFFFIFFSIYKGFFSFFFFGGGGGVLGIVSHKGLLDRTIKIKTKFAL